MNDDNTPKPGGDPMIDVHQTETEAQAAERVRRARARAALRAASETAARLRAAGLPSDGRTEADVLPEWRTPLVTDAVDAADALFVTLRDWTEIWAGRLHLEAPAPGAWTRRDGTPLGFRAGTSQETASLIVTSVASWLLFHEDAIAAADGAAEYQVAVARAVWSQRDRTATTTSRRRIVMEASDRSCPVCGLDEVRGEFFGEPMESAEARGEHLLEELDGVGVRCAYCGWKPDATLSSVARWLSGDASKHNRNAPERQDFDLEYWSINQAAKHFGFSPQTIRKYIRDGLPTYLGGRWVSPAEVVAEVLGRSSITRDTRLR
jgi:hypothetical protein